MTAYDEKRTTKAPTATELLANLSYPAVLDHLADDVEWHLPLSLWDGVRGAHIGRAAVEKMLATVMTEFYDPETFSFDIITAFGTDTQASMVCIVNATTQWGQRYRNNYAVTVETKDGKIARVYEVFDTKNLFDTVDNTKLGTHHGPSATSS
jgi:ketosteroid isomerase-like protein